jgi:hypothetical protein
MSSNDRFIAMHARHACARTPLDISEMVVGCNRGCVELYGKVKRPRGVTGHLLDMKKELDILVTMVRSTRGVKDVITSRLQIMD